MIPNFQICVEHIFYAWNALSHEPCHVSISLDENIWKVIMWMGNQYFRNIDKHHITKGENSKQQRKSRKNSNSGKFSGGERENGIGAEEPFIYQESESDFWSFDFKILFWTFLRWDWI